MQQRGLYRTFKSIEEFKAQLRDHMDTLLQDFQALLIPAGRALAYGYREFHRPGVRHPARAHGGTSRLSTAARIVVLFLPHRAFTTNSLDEATDNAVFDLRRQFLEEISVTTPNRRRPSIYIPRSSTRSWTPRESEDRGADLDRLDVIDFPTPMIVLNKFVRYLDRSLLRGRNGSSAELGYGNGKSSYSTTSSSRRSGFLKEEGKTGPSIKYFQYRNSQDFILPA